VTIDYCDVTSCITVPKVRTTYSRNKIKLLYPWASTHGIVMETTSVIIFHLRFAHWEIPLIIQPLFFVVRSPLPGYLLPKASSKGQASVRVFIWYMHQTFALCGHKISSSNMVTTQRYWLPSIAQEILIRNRPITISVLGPLKTSCPLILTKPKKLFFTALRPETFAFRLLCQELKELNSQRYLALM